MAKVKTTTHCTPSWGMSAIWHYVCAHFHAFKYSFYNLSQAPATTFLTISAIGICLAFPMGLYLFVKNIQQLTHSLDQGTTLTLYVNPKNTPTQIQKLLAQVQQYPAVKKTTYLSQEEALAEFQSASGLKDTLMLLPENPLPAVISIGLNTQAYTGQEIQKIKEELSSAPEVLFASFDYEWIEKLNHFLTLGQMVSYFLYFIIGVGVILMVGNTIRLALERHKEEIAVFDLVGATQSYIRRPFLYRGLLYGGVGGIIAILILSLMIHLLHMPVTQLVSLYEGVFSLENLKFCDTVVLLIMSASLGWLGALVAFTQQHHATIKKSA